MLTVILEILNARESARPAPLICIPVAGVRIGVTEAGVRKANRKDLTVFLLDEGASVAGVFTQNRFCAAPVQVCREHLAAEQRGIRAHGHQHRQCQCRHRRRRPGSARATCDGAGRSSWACSRADPAVFDRRDHGSRCPWTASSPACPPPSPQPSRQLGRGRRRHHDHRHPAQGLQPPGGAGRRSRSPSPASARAPA